MTRLRLAAPALLIALAGCGGGGQTDPSGITPGEAQALNDAAEMLDADAIELDAGNTATPSENAQ